MAANSTRKASHRKSASDRPGKPYPDFPMTAHAGGKWVKKIRGKIHYFGRWGRIRNGKMERLPDDGWQEALKLFKAQWPDLKEGRKPREVKEGELSLAELCNRFLAAKLQRVNSNELSRRSLSEYRSTTDRLIRFFGRARLVEDLDAADFQSLRADIAASVGPVRLGTEVVRVKSVFKYAWENRLVDQPVPFGTEFRKPSKAVMRKHKATSDKKLFEPGEILALLDAANPTMKAVIFLGINCGAGNTDVSNLEHGHLELQRGWLDYPRGKTGIGRRCPLWPETVDAVKQAISTRPTHDDRADKDVVFLSERGMRLVRLTDKSRTDGVTVGFGKLLRKLKINGRKRLGFYALRHTFATVGLQIKDRDAVKALMGHVEGDVLSAYNESAPSDDRLRAVTDHVRAWLFGGAA